MASQEDFNFKYERDLARRFLYLLDENKYKQYGPNVAVSTAGPINDDLPF